MNATASPRLMLAAPASGAGKTTLTIALLAAFAARGLCPAAFKCGPDFVDPLFHREILGVRGGNIDLFLSPPETARALFLRAAAGADAALLEGAMGFYDGVGGTDAASAWHAARETKTPVVLVVRPQGTFLTMAAVVAGLARFRENSGVSGILLNRCATTFARRLAPVLEKETGLRVYGHLPDMPALRIAERHLGLTPPAETAFPQSRARLRALAEAAEKTVDIPALFALAETAPPLAAALPVIAPAVTDKAAAPRIAVARDGAFCFHYEENLALLRALGAELVFFSPLADAALPAGTSALCLGGGYPELHAAALAANAPLRREIKTALESALPCIAEGGGFLYLQRALADPSGAEHPMVGHLAGTGRNAARPVRFGYQMLRAHADNLLLRAGEEIPAHEFHYWDSDNTGADCTAKKPGCGAGEESSKEWPSVVATPALFAGFPHLYFWSNPNLARCFVEAAAKRKNT